MSQRALQAHADPWLGHTTIDGKGFVVSELSPYTSDLDWSELTEPADMEPVLAYLGRATAKTHCVSDSDSEQTLVDFQSEDAITDEEDFTRSLTSFAMSYAQQTREDHRLFVDAFRGGEIPGVQAVRRDFGGSPHGLHTDGLESATLGMQFAVRRSPRREMIDPPELMLATPTDRRFSDDDWFFERKLDGVRAMSIRDGWRPQLWSRNHKRLDDGYPELVELLAAAGGTHFITDGEIVRVGDTVHYYLFDLLSLGGIDLTGRPLRERKAILRTAFRFQGPLRYSEHREAEGEAYYQQACDNGWEGLIAKRADSPYRGGRSADWLKFKCLRGQEFVVGGFTEPQGSRAGFGALIVGYHEDGLLRYAGKVGTGYDHATLRALRARMDTMAQDESPFADQVPEPTAHWIRPELVVQVGFSEWTRDGRLRHPRFGGLRTDKPPAEVVRE